jgi:hypothetical protein
MMGPWVVLQSNEGASVCEWGVHRFYAKSQQDGAVASAYLNGDKIRIDALAPVASTPRTPDPPSKRERMFLTIFQSLIESRNAPNAMDEANEALSVVNFVDRAL